MVAFAANGGEGASGAYSNSHSAYSIRHISSILIVILEGYIS
jgi:hypothetical protein